jgi:hypothetical protein
MPTKVTFSSKEAEQAFWASYESGQMKQKTATKDDKHVASLEEHHAARYTPAPTILFPPRSLLQRYVESARQPTTVPPPTAPMHTGPKKKKNNNNNKKKKQSYNKTLPLDDEAKYEPWDTKFKVTNPIDCDLIEIRKTWWFHRPVRRYRKKPVMRTIATN